MILGQGSVFGIKFGRAHPMKIHDGICHDLDRIKHHKRYLCSLVRLARIEELSESIHWRCMLVELPETQMFRSVIRRAACPPLHIAEGGLLQLQQKVLVQMK